MILTVLPFGWNWAGGHIWQQTREFSTCNWIDQDDKGGHMKEAKEIPWVAFFLHSRASAAAKRNMWAEALLVFYEHSQPRAIPFIQSRFVNKWDLVRFQSHDSLHIPHSFICPPPWKKKFNMTKPSNYTLNLILWILKVETHLWKSEESNTFNLKTSELKILKLKTLESKTL